MSVQAARFNLYRYQLLPVDRYFQSDLYGPATIEEVIANKNIFFRQALDSPLAFTGSRTKVVNQKLFESDDFILYRLAAFKALSHETQDFRTEKIDHWPKILVAIWNRPDKQLIAVQHRSAAFQNTEAAVKLIFGSLSELLSKQQLTVIWEPLFEKHIFWDLVNKFRGAIQEIEFEIVTPNMANISGSLPEDLKEFAKMTNSVRNKLSISADPSAALNVSPNNPVLEGLVDYSSEGGGDISVQIKGVRKRVHTSKTVKEVSIEEASLIGEPDVVAQLLKELMS